MKLVTWSAVLVLLCVGVTWNLHTRSQLGQAQGEADEMRKRNEDLTAKLGEAEGEITQARQNNGELAAREEKALREVAAAEQERQMQRKRADGMLALLAGLHEREVKDAKGRLKANLEKAFANVEASSDPERTYHDARAAASLGYTLTLARRDAEARIAYEKAAALIGKLDATFPNQPEYRVTLARILNDWGNVLRQQGQFQEARACYAIAVEEFKRRAIASPEDAERINELSLCHHNIGGVLLELKKPQEAAALLRDVVARREQLHEKNEGNRIIRLQLGESCWYLAMVLNSFSPQDSVEAARQKADVEKYYLQAIKFLQPLVDEKISNPQAIHNFGVAQSRYASFLVVAGRPGESLDHFRTALDVLNKLVRAYPVCPDYRSDLVLTLSNRGRSAIVEGDFKLAKELMEQAATHRRQIADVFKNEPAWVPNYYADYEHLIEMSLKVGDYKAAARAAMEFPSLLLRGREEHLYVVTRLAECKSRAAEDKALPKNEREGLETWYENRAMELLRVAVTKGHVNTETLKKDTRLNPIRQHPDFQRLVAESERQKTP